MTKSANTIYSFSFHILKFIGVIFSLLLFVCGLLFSSSDADITTIQTFVTADNIFSGIAGILFFLGLLLLLYIPCKKYLVQTVRILLAVTLSIYAVIGTLLIVFAKSAPHTDSLFVYEIAKNCAKNDFTDINPDSYLSVYPHQIGLVFFYEPLLRLWNLLGIHTEAYIFLQFVNLLLVLTLIYFLYKLTDKLFQNSITTAYSLVLIIGCLPLYLYILRVYGDVPSLTFFIVGMWAFTEIISQKPAKTHKNLFHRGFLYILNIACFILSIATRKNIVIALIALMIITFLIALSQKRWSLLFLLGGYLIISIFTLPAIEAFYETRAENCLDEGTPPIAYITMGMQTAPRANGWYNAFNYNVYVESGHNMEFINIYSEKLIEERLAYFKENPKEAFNFYFEKCASQWCDGTYASRELTAYTLFKRPAFFDAFYGQDGGTIFIFVCNGFQTLLYFGVLVFCIKNSICTGDKNIFPYIGILIAFGGFLFHILWEANSRAIFPYTLLLLPIAGAGIATLLSKVSFSVKKKHFT